MPNYKEETVLLMSFQEEEQHSMLATSNILESERHVKIVGCLTVNNTFVFPFRLYKIIMFIQSIIL